MIEPNCSPSIPQFSVIQLLDEVPKLPRLQVVNTVIKALKLLSKVLAQHIPNTVGDVKTRPRRVRAEARPAQQRNPTRVTPRNIRASRPMLDLRRSQRQIPNQRSKRTRRV